MAIDLSLNASSTSRTTGWTLAERCHAVNELVGFLLIRFVAYNILLYIKLRFLSGSASQVHVGHEHEVEPPQKALF